MTPNEPCPSTIDVNRKLVRGTSTIIPIFSSTSYLSASAIVLCSYGFDEDGEVDDEEIKVPMRIDVSYAAVKLVGGASGDAVVSIIIGEGVRGQVF